MHLLIGNPQDFLCLSLQNMLDMRGCAARIISNPMASPWRLAWHLDNNRSASKLVCDGDAPIADHEIESLVVRPFGWIDPEGWQPEDLAYIQSENQAALLAWLWSLPCPVINRYRSGIWFCPQTPLLSWYPLLRRCGLPVPETLMTNVEQEAREFGLRHRMAGLQGTAVYGPLTTQGRYLLSSDDDWAGVAAMQRYAPVCLAYPHESPQLVCVVGEEVIYDGQPTPKAATLAPALHRFARAAGLTFLQLALAANDQGVVVVSVEPYPQLEIFGDIARQEVLEAIVNILTAPDQRVVRANSSVAPGTSIA